jgi:hypothetical protein
MPDGVPPGPEDEDGVCARLIGAPGSQSVPRSRFDERQRNSSCPLIRPVRRSRADTERSDLVHRDLSTVDRDGRRAFCECRAVLAQYQVRLPCNVHGLRTERQIIRRAHAPGMIFPGYWVSFWVVALRTVDEEELSGLMRKSLVILLFVFRGRVLWPFEPD